MLKQKYILFVYLIISKIHLQTQYALMFTLLSKRRRTHHLLFINDFKHNIANTYPGLNIADSCYPTLNDNSIILIKMFLLVYADDTNINSKLLYTLYINTAQGTT